MAYSVNWITKVITIPTSDLVLVSGTRYSLPMGDFLTECRRLEWEPTEGLWAPNIVDHDNARPDFAGANYAGFDEIVNGYTVQFSGAATRVDLLDSNNNFVDQLITTGVSVVPSNSAGLTFSKQNQDLAFTDARVWVDTANGTAGSIYPTGTPGQPCLTFPDAITVAVTRGLPNRYRGIGTATVSGGNLDGFDLLGASPELSMFTISPGVSTAGLLVAEADLTATFDGDVSLRNCVLGNINNFSGDMRYCKWKGDIQLSATRTEIVSLSFCNSEQATTSRPILDMNGTSADVLLDRYTGGIEITNMTAGNDMTINGGPCSVRIAASCTSGTIKIRGDLAYENLATGNPGFTLLVYENDDTSKYERIEAIYNDIGSGGTITPGDISDIADGVWGYNLATWKASTVGAWITKKLLTVTKFLSLK